MEDIAEHNSSKAITIHPRQRHYFSEAAVFLTTSIPLPMLALADTTLAVALLGGHALRHLVIAAALKPPVIKCGANNYIEDKRGTMVDTFSDTLEATTRPPFLEVFEQQTVT